jgi:hypothetical protein
MLSYEEAGKALLLMDYEKKLPKAKLIHLSKKMIKKGELGSFLVIRQAGY